MRKEDDVCGRARVTRDVQHDSRGEPLRHENLVIEQCKKGATVPLSAGGWIPM